MDLLEKYNKINNSYNKKLVFHLGAAAGFYSEFNNMIYAMLYCLKNEYQFILYSNDANFKIERGWTDFFLPFCKQSTNDIHHIVNKRVLPPKLCRREKLRLKNYKFWNPKTVFTHQLWSKFFTPEFENEHFKIPQLGIDGNLKEAAHTIVNMIYRPNQFLQKNIDDAIKKISLPKDYVALNIRRGDKNTEFEYITTETFVNALQQKNYSKNVFVFTDDFTVIEELKANSQFSNQYSLYYLIDESERGYVHADFLTISVEEKMERLLKMFSSMDIMSKAKLSFGSYTNNPGFFLGMKMKDGDFISLQKKIWYQFDVRDIRNQMSQDMEKFYKSVNAKL